LRGFSGTISYFELHTSLLLRRSLWEALLPRRSVTIRAPVQLKKLYFVWTKTAGF
jgi:hypothetical protein